jgi:hypothetical protein
LVFDAAETIQYATLETLGGIGLSPEDAWAIAPGNLSGRLGELEIGEVEGAEHLVYVTGGNGLAPSTLANGRFCATDNAAAFIFLIVERNGYVMAERNRAAALSQFRALYDELRGNGGSLSQTPIACENGRMSAVTLTD